MGSRAPDEASHDEETPWVATWDEQDVPRSDNSFTPASGFAKAPTSTTSPHTTVPPSIALLLAAPACLALSFALFLYTMGLAKNMFAHMH
eukprot:CAMPEP_0184382614 /NCGR_PEP_ID=MMETSP0007-20130409/6470_1 /TAXON_ID=97485 /ORGANISM="Prymnesium parvum, Strain Texoma1" /LENGTH=89 /DNA_ID=CAMNT_0026728727 /DNA_START=78 /DNA_END=348 /DNA_ORIENTATION=-